MIIMMNLHNHTNLSDGRYPPREIIEAGIEFGLTHIAITDHYMTSKVDSIPYDGLLSYIEEIKVLSEEFQDTIKVLCGVEIDSCKDRTDVSKISFEDLSTLDFVLFEYVQNDIWNGMPLWELLGNRENIKCPVGLAHNDIGKNFSHTRYEELIAVLEANNIFIELCPSLRNSKLNKPYYHFAEGFFSSLSGSEVLISIGTDTHSNIKNVGNIHDAMDFIDRFGLEDNLITKIF
ncbi:MAG: PHP domain-containing protein [Methanomassiliicoccales archaeon]|nr:MAG: PHP domain-containing protein [Methanomassiliicoccales archaeon]